MMRCLDQLWKRSNHSTQPEAAESAFPQLPDELGRDEYAARFIFEPRHLMKGAQAGRPKPQAFKPECFEGNWELSVCRNTGLHDERIWAIGRTCRPHRPAIARADLGMTDVHAVGLIASMMTHK